MDGTYIGLDLETTGPDPQSDKIIEVGLVKLEDGVIVETFSSLVNPNRKLPLKIKRLTGINDEMLSSAPCIAEIMPQVIDFIGDYPIIGHNVRFDINFLHSACSELSLPAGLNILYDTVDLAQIVLPNAFNHRLSTVCDICNIELLEHHRAPEDAKAAALLAVELVKRIKKFEMPLMGNLLNLLMIAKSPWYNVLVRAVTKEFADHKIGSKVGLRPLPENQAQVKKIKILEREHLQPVSESKAAEFLDKNGLLSEAFERYEHRPQQLEMAKAVTAVINNSGFLLAEAGTGTGKSIAYLLPAVCWAVQNRQRVVISTHTINLQEQLWNKDIPLLQSLPGMDFKAALVKGRSNYICLRRWQAALNNPANSPQEAVFYARILVWLTLTETGDRSELNFSWNDLDLWNNLCAESDNCLGKRCGFYYNYCFVNRVKRQAEQANIIIANHSLIFSDVSTENRVLPQYNVLVMDEAHHLEKTATEYLGTCFNRRMLARWLSRVSKVISRLNVLKSLDDCEQWADSITEIKELQLRVREAADVLFTLLSDYLYHNTQSVDGKKYTLRLKPGSLNYAEVEIENLISRINTLCGKMQLIAEKIDHQSVEKESEAAREIVLAAETGFTLAADAAYTCACDNSDIVYWIEGVLSDTAYHHISIHAAPIEVGPLLYMLLYQNKDAIIFTSATLTVSGSFQHFIERSGLDLVKPELVKTLRLNSPFCYDDQSFLTVINDLPDPRSKEEDYLNALAEVIRDIVEITEGRTLVLFTAHKILREVYLRLKANLEEQEILLLGHDIDGSRTRLVEEFKKNERSVLFGASSFWEGLDIPGRSLSCVILVKLPFSPPNNPIVEARVEALERANKNGFLHFSLPDAIIKFKQGFGRLIRTRYDRGVVIVLDRRIIDKKYGRHFLGSLPVTTHYRGEKNKMLSKIKLWLKKAD